MGYHVKEIFYTLQGEGAQAGRAAVFCRFSGCNLWSGREVDRATAVCRFCDTDFIGTDGVGGGRFASAEALVAAVVKAWPTGAGGVPYVVCTGGEPLLQLDAELVAALQAAGFEVAVETNGTIAPPAGLNWICVSPKVGTELKVLRGDELKLVYPQAGVDPAQFAGLDFRNFFLQPLDNADRQGNTEAAVRYCLEHPQWRISLQTHKYLGIP
ncbi:MAG TPA: 7-carboxy-7-deazaguanine synthase [Gammaproteobacteria bacterium]|nr:7-carboxy-7-deazaguanine synthase [Gammaproteobacteria bacterium]